MKKTIFISIFLYLAINAYWMWQYGRLPECFDAPSKLECVNDPSVFLSIGIFINRLFEIYNMYTLDIINFFGVLPLFIQFILVVFLQVIPFIIVVHIFRFFVGRLLGKR